MPTSSTARPCWLAPATTTLATILALLLITAAGLWVRADNLGRRSFSLDEALHVFAARSLLERGEPTLPSGELYLRALPLTRVVAAVFARWGESEATARLPSAVAGVLAIPAAYAVGASMFGSLTGLLAAFLVAFSPDAVAMSRFVRMYAPLQLLMLLTAWGLYVGLTGVTRGGDRSPSTTSRAVAFAAGAALLFLSAHLHAEAYLLLPPLGLYVALMAAATAVKASGRGVSGRAPAEAPSPPAHGVLGVAPGRGPCEVPLRRVFERRPDLARPEGPPARAPSEADRANGKGSYGSAYGLALGVGLAAALLVLIVEPETVSEIWHRGMTRLPWFPAEAWDVRFYHRYLADTYSYLWFLAPAATVAVLVTAFAPGLYLALLFWIPFAVLSAVVQTQTQRYLSPFLPFLLILLAEAGRQAGGLLWGRLTVRLAATLPWPRLARPLAALLFVVILAGVVRASPWFGAALADRIKPVGTYPGVDQDQWREAAAYVAASGVRDGAIIANADHLALYYFGRIDGRLLYRGQTPHAGDRAAERAAGGWRFSSYRTGAPAFSGVEDLAAAIARHQRGWLIVERRRLEAFPSAFAPGVRTFILKQLEAKETPADQSLVLFFWDHAASSGSAQQTMTVR